MLFRLSSVTVRPYVHDVVMMKRMFDSTAGRASAVQTAAALRRHRASVVRWSLAHGHLLDRDSLAVIINAAAQTTPGQVRLLWTSEQLRALLEDGCSNWCGDRKVHCPDGLTTTATTYLRYLCAHRLFSPDSDNMTALKRSVVEYEKQRCERLNEQHSSKGAQARHPTAQQQFLAPVLPLY
jgi:hypothetical protein